MTSVRRGLSEGLHVERISFDKCTRWHFTPDELRHESERFFSVKLFASRDSEHVFIDQPEIGILGFCIVDEAGIRYWILQRKPEPGNVSIVQWAPTVQATKSNYDKVHGGRETAFLDLFTAAGNNHLVDVAGSEQGDRFLNKFNRNIKVVLSDCLSDFVGLTEFCAVTNEELKASLSRDFYLNTDSRSVISTGEWSLLSQSRDRMFLGSTSCHPSILEALNISYLTFREGVIAAAFLRLDQCALAAAQPLRQVRWEDSKFFRRLNDGIWSDVQQRVVGYFDCCLPSREVPRWQQPLFEKSSIALYCMPVQVLDGIAYIGIRAEAELGFYSRAEFTVCVKREYRSISHIHSDLGGISKLGRPLLSVQQSDEGGRFWRNIGLYVITLVNDTEATALPDDTQWVTLGELEALTMRSGVVTNELRTSISVLLSLA